MNKEKVLNKIETVGFLGYFLILLIERVLALILSFNQGDKYAVLSGHPFGIIAYIFTAIGVVGGIIILFKPTIEMVKSLFSKDGYNYEKNYKVVMIGSIVLLLGGMMHTGFTLAPLQFVAYGFLIISMLVRIIDAINKGENKFDAIISFIYLTAFSMTIPVCYMTNLEGIQGTLFYITEFITTMILLFVFYLMLYQYFKDGKSDFKFNYFIVMVVLDGLTIALKWIDEINMFVLIFVVVSIIVYLVNYVKTRCLSQK